MVHLRTYQAELKKLIFLQEKEATHSLLWGKDIPERLRVYRNNTRTNWTDTLDYDFTLTRAQFKPEDWQRLRRRYFIKHPPRHWELNASMEPFVSFLKTQKVQPSIKELADYEWHDLKIFIDRSVVRKGSGLTNPTAVVRVYQHQIFNWAEKQAPRDQPPERTPEVLVFYRDSRNTCHIREADPLMILMMEHFRQPRARLETLEPVRRRLLPTNHVSLATVANSLRRMELLL